MADLTNIVVAGNEHGVLELLCPACALRLYDDVAGVELEPRYTWENNETDTPNHCPHCDVLLEEDLTPHGVQYVREQIVEQLAELGHLNWPLDTWFERWGDELAIDDSDRVTSPEGTNFGSDAVTDRAGVLHGYLDALLWTGTFEWMTNTAERGGEPLCGDSVLDHFAGIDDLPESIVKEATEDVDSFLDGVEDHARLFPNLHEIGPVTMGHDLCLTRNRHGAGFWDGELGQLGEYLTHAAHTMGGHYIMGAAVLIDPAAADPLLLSSENLDLDTLTIWSGC